MSPFCVVACVALGLALAPSPGAATHGRWGNCQYKEIIYGSTSWHLSGGWKPDQKCARPAQNWDNIQSKSDCKAKCTEYAESKMHAGQYRTGDFCCAWRRRKNLCMISYSNVKESVKNNNWKKVVGKIKADSCKSEPSALSAESASGNGTDDHNDGDSQSDDYDDEDDKNNALVTAVIVLALALTVSLSAIGYLIYSSRQRGPANPAVDAQGESAPDDDAEGNDGDDDAEGNDGDDDAFEPTRRASVFAI